jgi:hypothetical protein
MNALERIEICTRTRQKMAGVFTSLLSEQPGLSELAFKNALAKHIREDEVIYPCGWYDPPPCGIAALFTAPGEFSRLQFDSLRKEEFWPKESFTFREESVAMVYVSPVDKASGAIGDFGMTVYRGKDEKVRQHLRSSLEAVVGFCEVGMEFRGVHEFGQEMFRKRGLTNARTVAWTDTVGMSLGHTASWTYEAPSPSEQAVIEGNDFNTLKDLISRKRVNVNGQETFKIPPTIAFTIEARLESVSDPELPNVFYHFVVAFQDGKKVVAGGFNQVFQALDMDGYIASKY